MCAGARSRAYWTRPPLAATERGKIGKLPVHLAGVPGLILQRVHIFGDQGAADPLEGGDASGHSRLPVQPIEVCDQEDSQPVARAYWTRNFPQRSHGAGAARLAPALLRQLPREDRTHPPRAAYREWVEPAF